MLSGNPSIYVVNSTDGGNSGTGNTGTLPYVVGLANNDPNTAGSVIEFDPTVFDPQTSHTIILQATLDLQETGGPEVIDGPGVSVARVSGGGNHQVFLVFTGVTAKLSNLAITDGKAVHGGGIENQGRLNVATCLLFSNSAASGPARLSGSGGAIYNSSGASLSVAGSTCELDSAVRGGGIFVAGGMVTVGSSTFEQNSVQSGGAIFNDSGTVKIAKSLFKLDFATGNGGAIANTAGTLDAVNCTFVENQATSSQEGDGSLPGGAIYMNGGAVSIVGGNIEFNRARNGGGIYVQSGNLTLSSSLIESNSAQDGGGIYNKGSLTVVDTEFYRNSADFYGGAIDNYQQMSVHDSGFTKNSAGFSGGAISNSEMGSATVTGSTVALNGAIGQGGGVSVRSGQLTLINSTVAENAAPNGAGVAVNARFTAINDTIADNLSPGGLGGGLYVDTSTNFLYNTIVAQNTFETGPSPASDIVVSGLGSVTGSYNLIGTGGSGGLMDGQDGNQVGVVDPGLGNLAFNGGPTETIALLAGSPAIDAGSNSISGVTVPTIDQRGALRGPAGLNAGATGDIGAFEASSSYLVTATDDSFAVGTLRSAVDWANRSSNANPANLGNPAPNTVVFDTSGVFSTPQTITLNQSLGTLDLSGTNVPIAIDGPTSAALTVSGGGNVGVFQVDAGVTANFTRLTIADGASGLGGGVNNAGILTIDDSILTDNTANAGGGISNVGNLTLMSSTLVGNSTDLDFGGAVSNNGTMSVTDSTLADNSAAEGGGAIITNDSLTLTNVTIAGNSAGTVAGGIYETGGTLTTVNVTIADNNVAAGGSGGGLEVDGGSAALDNTIVALNTEGTGGSASASDISALQATLSGSYNVIGTGGSGGLVNGVDHNQVGVASPVLGTLASNGGPTQTIALLPGSPAIGGGSSNIPGVTVPTTDQRGVARPANSIDVGAFQDQGFVLTLVPGSSPQTTQINTAFANPLAVVVSSPVGDPVAGGVVTFTAPASGASATFPGGTKIASASINGSGDASSGLVTANGIPGSYAALATTSGVATGTSFSLTNTPAPATQLVIHTQPSGTATAGSAFSTQPVVYVEDQYGNLETGDDTTLITVSLRVGAGPLLGTTTVIVSGGIADFTNLHDDKAETIILLFTAPALVKVQPNPITVSAAAASRLSIAAPATASAGRPFTIKVTGFDPYNNVATGYRGTVNFTSSDNRASLPSVYTFTSGDRGVHTFGNGVTLRTSGSQTITADDVFHPSIIGSTSVSVGGGAAPDALAIGGNGRSAGAQAREAISPRAQRSKARAAPAASPHRTTAEAGRARVIAQADAARDRVLAELRGNVHAYLMAERLVGRRLE